MTQKHIQKILSSVPDTVDKAYSAILERSENKAHAKKLLSIILSAVRPLTLHEMNAAMAIEASCRSYYGLDVIPEDKWNVVVRNLCGLFVTIVDSRVYLIHQTAREFLLASSEPVIPHPYTAHTQNWRHSISLQESNFTLARICIWYLLLAEFDTEGLQLRSGFGVITKQAPLESDILSYSSQHVFLSYAAEHWAFHFRESHNKIDVDLLKAVSFRVCNVRSSRFSNWFPIYWTSAKKNEPHYPHDINSMAVACHLGLEPVVLLLLQHGAEVDGLFGLGRTPLSWAAEAGNVSVVRLLLDRCAEPSFKSRGQGIWRAGTTAYKERVKSVVGRGLSRVRENHSPRPGLPAIELSSNNRTQARVFKQRIDINTTNSLGETSLMLAAMNGHKHVVELLIEKSARLGFGDHSHQEAATIKAARNGHEEVVMLLLERIPRVKSHDKAFGSVLVNGATFGQMAVVKMMLDRGVNKEFKDECGQTALSKAAKHGHLPVVELLLDNDADIETQDREGYTPLMYAIHPPSDSVTAMLLRHHANVETKNKAGQTAISVAVRFYKSGPMINWGPLGLLLEHGATLKTTHDENLEILMTAARKGQTSMLRFLLEKKNLSIESRSKPSTERSVHNLTPLIEAAIGGYVATVEFLLERNAKIEAKDSDGKTPLAWAAQARWPTVVRVLLENNAEIESRNIRAQTPLLLLMNVTDQKLRCEERERVAETLLTHGADAEAEDNDGMTPLLSAVAQGWAAGVRSLVEHNVRTDYKDQNGRTALELAEYLGEKRIITLLLRHDPQSSSEQDWTRTLLSEAAEKGSGSVVKQCLDEDYDIEAKDGIFSQSPLLWAAENGHEKVVRPLLEHGTQIESNNKYGQTALWLSVRNGHVSVVKLLLERNAIAELEDNASRTPSMVADLSGNTAIKMIVLNHIRFKNGLV